MAKGEVREPISFIIADDTTGTILYMGKLLNITITHGTAAHQILVGGSTFLTAL